MKKTIVKDCNIIELPIYRSGRKGNITPIYNHEHVPFAIERVYYLYDVPARSERGGHAHKKLEQLIVRFPAVSILFLRMAQKRRKLV